MTGFVRRGCAMLAGVAALLNPQLSHAAAMLPDFGAATFTPGAAITNPYLPFKPGTLTRFRGEFVEDGETVVEEFERLVLSERRSIGGVDTAVVRDRAIVDGLVVEDTYDFYAQDTVGNVWYLGEDVTNYIYDDDGNLIGTNSDSAWRTGVNGGLPGFAMPSDLTLGFEYFQEYAVLDGALDIGQVFAKGLTLPTIFGDLTGVLQVFETSAADATLREFKYYAPGIGLVQVDEALSDAFVPEFSLYLVDAGVVPEPTTWALMIVGFGLTGAVLRRRAGPRSSFRQAASGHAPAAARLT